MRGRKAEPKPLRTILASRLARSLALQQGKSWPVGRPEAASRGGKLSGQQPRIAARAIGRPGGQA
eukprot:scaffold25989_cov78-Phaeocystis_antarctica.AAC.1